MFNVMLIYCLKCFHNFLTTSSTESHSGGSTDYIHLPICLWILEMVWCIRKCILNALHGVGVQ